MSCQDKQNNIEALKKAFSPLLFSVAAGVILLFVVSETLAAGKPYLSEVVPLTIFQTVGFYVLIALFLFLLMGGLYQLKIRKLREQIGELETGVSERDAQLGQLKNLQNEVADKAHKAGMADIASGVLHNVGNVLNSVNTSSSLIKEKVQQSKLDSFIQANTVLRKHMGDIGRFMADNPKGKTLLNYYLSLEKPMKEERGEIIELLDRLTDKINLINEVIAAQQSYAGADMEMEAASLSEMIENTLALQASLIEKYKLNVKKKLNAGDRVMVYRSKFIHVLVNIIKNAIESMEETPPEKRHLFIETWQKDDKVSVSVTDTGKGIEQEDREKIFFHSFTTRRDGHGFGLHSSANYMSEMGGKIDVASGGAGKGSTFTLMLPITN